MLTDPGRARRSILIVGSVSLVVVGSFLARGATPATSSDPSLGSRPLPAAVAGTPAGDTPTTAASAQPVPSATGARAPSSHAAVIRPGVPVAIDIAVNSPNHPHGVHAHVQSNLLSPIGALVVPADPSVVSWAKQDAAPGSARGTAIITGHINYVINGRLVLGALSDLADYARSSVGARVTLRLADGRRLGYRIVAGREYTKNQLADDPRLRRSLYNQQDVYGPAGSPSGRLLLVSCGGPFDPDTGEYENNVFLYALPVG